MQIKRLLPIISLSFFHSLLAMYDNYELLLLRRREYGGDFKTIRDQIVTDYKREVQSKIAANNIKCANTGYVDESVTALHDILESVNYPLGRASISPRFPADWLALVDVANKAIQNCNREDYSELNDFYAAVQTILNNHGFVLRVRPEQEEISESELLRHLNGNGAGAAQPPQSYMDFTSVNTVIRSGFILSPETERNTVEDMVNRVFVAKLLSRLVVCLPTRAEIHYWRWQSGHSSDFLCEFRRRGEESLLEMRYEIRTDRAIVRGNPEELEKWVYDNFVEVCRKLSKAYEETYRIPGISSEILSRSLRGLSATQADIVKNIGEVLLRSQKADASRERRKPFIISYRIPIDIIRNYLVRRLGFIVHEVSAHDLYKGGVAQGEPYPWKKSRDQLLSAVAVNRGWLVDTFLDDGEDRSPFLNNIMLIKNAEVFLDRRSAGISDEMCSFIKKLISYEHGSVWSPYLNDYLNTEHLIVLMASETERSGGKLSSKLSPLLSLYGSMYTAVAKPMANENVQRTAVAKPPANENAQRTAVEKPAANENAQNDDADHSEILVMDKSWCYQVAEDFLKDNRETIAPHELKMLMGQIFPILSGQVPVDEEAFDCPEGTLLVGHQENFLETRSPEFIKSLLQDFIRKNKPDD